MKKKIISMITLAAFALTLVPMAAFAAGPEAGDSVETVNVVDPNNSTIATDEEMAEGVVGTAVKLDFKVKVSEKPNTEASATDVYVWAVNNETKEVVRNVEFANGNGAMTFLSGKAVYKIPANSVANAPEMTVKFAEAGDYTIKAGMQNGTSFSDIVDFLPVDNKSTVKVANKEVTVTGYEGNTVTVDAIKANGVERNTVDGLKVVGTNVPKGAVVKIDNPYKGIKVVNADRVEVSELKTTAAGTTAPVEAFSLVVDSSMVPAKQPAVYKLGLTCNDKKGTLEVTVNPKEQDASAATIEALPVEGILNVDAVTDQIQFVMKDADGVAKTSFTPAEHAVEGASLNADYFTIVKKPAKSKLKAENLKLQAIEGKDKFKLVTTEPFIAGEYTISVALNNGKKAETTFTVAEAGDTVKIEVAQDTDKVALGETANFKVFAVDKDGVKTDISNEAELKFGVTPVKNLNITPATGESAKVTVAAADGLSDEETKALYGQKVVVKAYYMDKFIAAEDAVFTVTDPEATPELSMKIADQTGDLAGKILTNETVTAKLVDANDEDDDTAYAAFIVEKVSQSDETANVSIVPDKATKSIGIYSDKAVELEIKVTALVGNAVYGDTFKYVITEDGNVAPETESMAAAMTIGAKQVVVNNKVVELDVAPFVAQNRTFVPFRAFGEEVLGAKVEWNEKDRVVTYTLDDTVVEMTIGEKTFKVTKAGKTEEKTMDVAPVIKDNRTFVPVRFLAENFDVEVTPVYAANGTTAGVIFQK